MKLSVTKAWIKVGVDVLAAAATFGIVVISTGVAVTVVSLEHLRRWRIRRCLPR